MSKLGSHRVGTKWRPRFRYGWTLAIVGNGFWGGGNPTPLYASFAEARQACPDLQLQPVRVRVTIAEPERAEQP